MNASRRNAMVALGLMGAAAAGAVVWRPTAKLADSRAKVDLETMFPRQFGEWILDDQQPVQLVSPDQAAVLNAIYNQTLSRTYVNRTGERIMVSVAYGGDQSDATRAHRPEVCYPAQGFQIEISGSEAVVLGDGVIPVRRLVARAGGRTEPITYWMVVGEKVTVSGPQMKLAQLSYSIRGTIPDGMLIRISNISADSQSSFSLHDRFINDLAGVLSGPTRKQVLGA